MAVITGKNNTLGMLGTLASVAGMATGQPWLSALGTGMQGMNAIKNGNSSMQTGQATSGALNEVLNSLKDVWKNPAKTAAQNIKDKVQEMTDTELADRWTVPQYSFISPKQRTFWDFLGDTLPRVGIDVLTGGYGLGSVLFPYEESHIMY